MISRRFRGLIDWLGVAVWLALIVAGLVLGLIVPRLRRWLPLLLVASAVLIAAVLVLSPEFRDVLVARITTERSVYDRQNTNEAALYRQLMESGTTLISIAHRSALLKYHTQVLELTGDGGWQLHDARAFRFRQ